MWQKARPGSHIWATVNEGMVRKAFNKEFEYPEQNISMARDMGFHVITGIRVGEWRENWEWRWIEKE